MSKRLFVGNLPFKMGFEDLKKEFSAYEPIEEASVIVNKYTGRSKGFGFITLSDDAKAEKAIKEMNGKEVNGRKLVVNEARPMTEKKQDEDFKEKRKK